MVKAMLLLFFFSVSCEVATIQWNRDKNEDAGEKWVNKTIHKSKRLFHLLSASLSVSLVSLNFNKFIKIHYVSKQNDLEHVIVSWISSKNLQTNLILCRYFGNYKMPQKLRGLQIDFSDTFNSLLKIACFFFYFWILHGNWNIVIATWYTVKVLPTLNI